jgi:hypothetical protein
MTEARGRLMPKSQLSPSWRLAVAVAPTEGPWAMPPLKIRTLGEEFMERVQT